MSNIDALAGKINTLIDRLSQPATEAVIEAARTTAYSNLASALFFGAAGAVACRYLLRSLRIDTEQGEFGRNFAGERRALKWAGVVIAGVVTAVNIGFLIDPWLWATMSRPELYIAKKALGL